MDNIGSQENVPSSSSSSGIFYTRQRNKFTKTRNAASSARFRQNNRSSRGGGGKEDDSWFARKSAGWTDDAIRSHLVGGGGGRKREDGFGMIGDVIQGLDVDTDATTTATTTNTSNHIMPSTAANEDAKNELRSRKKSRNNRRVVGTKFAWEEEEEIEENENFGGRDRNDNNGDIGSVRKRRMMAPPPPTLTDIMDEQDEVDFASRTLMVQQQKQQQQLAADGEGGESIPSKQKTRRKNAALEELARISSGNVADNVLAGCSVRAMDGSIGHRLLKVLGYRSRLGLAIVPNSSSGRRQEQQQLLQQHQNQKRSGNEGIGNEANIENIDDALLLSKELSSRELSKWLSSKGLRAIRLPSIIHDNDRDESVNSTATYHDQQREQQQQKQKLLLTIPPPKLDRHGIGYDPFANAPEFREFRVRRLARARMLGRDGNSTAGGDGNAFRRKTMQSGEDRYFTDNLRDDSRRGLWDKASRKDNIHNQHDGDDDDDDEFDDISGSKRNVEHSHHHYAADRDFSDLVGTKSSSRFALEEDDDADVYNHDYNNTHDDGGHHGGGGGGKQEYTTEVQSPVASDAEDNGEEGGGIMLSSSTGRTSVQKKRLRRAGVDSDVIDEGVIAEAWSAWGTDGISTGMTDTIARTMDGKPPLTGFVLGKNATIGSSNYAPPMRWTGPILPSGYVLKRHVFRDEVISGGYDNAAVGVNDLDEYCGLGLNFQRRRPAHRRQIPTVLPSTSNQQRTNHTTPNVTPGKMLAMDGTEMNFQAVRESMKSRFVTSSAGSTNDDADGRATAAIDDVDEASEKNLDEEEWIRVTISPWIPTRLLCKRWGVPAPSTECLGGAGVTKRVRTDEETYFRDLVYDPAVADRNVKAGATPLSTTVNREKLVTAAFDEDESDDMAGYPPPSRPPAEIFRSIFDAAESDMDISSSSSSDNEKDEVAGIGRDKNVVDSVTPFPTAPIIGGMIAKVDDASSRAPDKQDAASIIASTSSSSSSTSNDQSSGVSRRRRRNHHHHHSRHRTSRDIDESLSDDGNSNDEQKRRGRYSRHSRQGRRGESSDEETRDDCHAKRRMKEKKKQRRSKHHRR